MLLEWGWQSSVSLGYALFPEARSASLPTLFFWLCGPGPFSGPSYVVLWELVQHLLLHTAQLWAHIATRSCVHVNLLVITRAYRKRAARLREKRRCWVVIF